MRTGQIGLKLCYLPSSSILIHPHPSKSGEIIPGYASNQPDTGNLCYAIMKLVFFQWIPYNESKVENYCAINRIQCRAASFQHLPGKKMTVKNKRKINKPRGHIKHFLYYLSWKTRIILYAAVLTTFLLTECIHLMLVKTPSIFIFSIIPIVFAGWFFNYRTVIITTLCLFITNNTIFIIYYPQTGTYFLPSYIIYYSLYIVIGLTVHKVILLYKELNQEKLEKRKSDILLEEEANWFRITLLSICDGIITVDSEKKIMFMNYEAEKLTGWSLSEVKGRDIRIVYNIINEHTREPVTDPILRILESGYIVGLANHTILINKEGKELPIGDSGIPIKDKDRNIIGFILVFRDISEKKEMEQELKKTQAQAIHSEKLAGIGQLAAGIAHEINNPLSYINSNLDTLEKYLSNMKNIIKIYKSENNPEYIKTQEEKFMINYILNDIDSLLKDNKEGIVKISRIIKNLKDFAQVNAQTTWEETNLNRLIENILLMVRSEVKYIAEINLNLKDLPMVYCNAGEINQVILNLIMNAVHAIKTKNGTGKGKIGIHTEADKKHVICRITDDGCGIPEPFIPRIFEPFFTTKEPGEGTGLGLYLVFDIIVKRHKGELMVNSQEGKGTVFTFKLQAAV